MKTLAILKEQNVCQTSAPSASPENFKKRHAARAVVLDENKRIALLKVKNKNYHKLPGGGIESEEDVFLALERELMEEIGCKAEVLIEVGKVIEYRDQWQMQQTSFCYLAKQIGEKCLPDFTDEEKADGFEIFWADNIKHAIELLENDNSSDYDGAFIKPRDLALLRAAENLI